VSWKAINESHTYDQGVSQAHMPAKVVVRCAAGELARRAPVIYIHD
jgi:hypothetical protein